METYLAIITTVLVATQIFRVTQNAIQLRKNSDLLEKQLGALSEIDDGDIWIKRQFYAKGLEYFEKELKKGTKSSAKKTATETK